MCLASPSQWAPTEGTLGRCEWCASPWPSRGSGREQGNEGEGGKAELAKTPCVRRRGTYLQRPFARSYLENLLGQDDAVLPVVVLDQVHVLHGGGDVLRLDARAIPNLLNADGLAMVPHHLQDGLRPVATVAEQAEVRERLFRRAALALHLRQHVAKLNQELAVALETAFVGMGECGVGCELNRPPQHPKMFRHPATHHPLKLRQRQNAGNVVLLRRLLFLRHFISQKSVNKERSTGTRPVREVISCEIANQRGSTHLGKVAHDMTAPHIAHGHDVEEKRVGIVVQCLQKGMRPQCSCEAQRRPGTGSFFSKAVLPLYLVIQEQFGQQAKVLAIVTVLSPVQLKELDMVLAVDFVAWWVPQLALGLGGRGERDMEAMRILL